MIWIGLGILIGLGMMLASLLAVGIIFLVVLIPNAIDWMKRKWRDRKQTLRLSK